GALGISLGAAGLYLMLSPPRYTATTRILTDTSRSHSTLAVDAVVDSAVIDSQIEIIRSEKIAIGVIKSLQLESNSEFIDPGILAKLWITMGFSSDGLTSDEERLQQSILNFERNLNVFRIGRSYAADINFTSLDRGLAARIANTVAKLYVKDQLDAKGVAAERANSWVEERIDELRRKHKYAREALEKFQSENRLTPVSGVGTRDRELDAEHQARLLELESSAESSKRKLEIYVNLSHYSQTTGVQSFPTTDARILAEALPPLRRSSPRV